MIGQYSHTEMLSMRNIVSTVSQLNRGYIIRRVSRTINYYRQHNDTSWTNYNCRVV